MGSVAGRDFSAHYSSWICWVAGEAADRGTIFRAEEAPQAETVLAGLAAEVSAVAVPEVRGKKQFKKPVIC